MNLFRASVAAKRLDRIDARGPARGDVSRRKGRGDDNQHADTKGREIEDAHEDHSGRKQAG